MKNRNFLSCVFIILLSIVVFAACASTSTRESTGEYIDDSVITTKVKALLAKDDFIKSFKISVETFRGIVQLSGTVDSQATVDKAEKITNSVKGVKSVKNNLVIK
jgi:osmotically-inducible protein OsmY